MMATYDVGTVSGRFDMNEKPLICTISDHTNEFSFVSFLAYLGTKSLIINTFMTAKQPQHLNM